MLIVDPQAGSSSTGKDEDAGRKGKDTRPDRAGENRPVKENGRTVDEVQRASGGKRRPDRKGKGSKKGVDRDPDQEVKRRGNSGESRGGNTASAPSIPKQATESFSYLTIEDDEEGGIPVVTRSPLPDTTRPESPDLSTSATTTATAPNASTESRSIPSIRIRVTDTLIAAQSLQQSLSTSSNSSNPPRVCILNMSSPLRPGGGFISGAASQEESLCMRTTLYPSLREEYYRLPEVGGVYTQDVLVFREFNTDSDSGVRDLEKGKRWWVDVVSAGMLRFPDIEEVDEEMRYISHKDRELVEDKMRAVLRIVKSQGRGVRGLILGAWGCGAYGNPVSEVTECWRRVLCGDNDELDASEMRKSKNGRSGKSVKEAEDLERERHSWVGIEIVFAIKERKMAVEFARRFGGDIEVGMDDQGDEEEESVEDGSESSTSELQSKINELEAQITASRSQVQKDMFKKILATLKKGQEDDG